MSQSGLVERFLRYVRCASESGKERDFCELVAQELTALGIEVTRDDAAAEAAGSNGFNLHAFLPGNGEPILFSAHMDTVFPGEGIRPVIADGVIRSSGDTILGADDKSAVAAVVEAVAQIKEQNLAHCPIEIFFSVCEEVGLLGAKYADYTRIRSKQAVVLDTADPHSLINRTPAKMNLHIEIKGRSAHAAVDPEKGVNAIKAAAAAVAAIPCGKVDDKTVMNVANFISPGKTNVVAEKAEFEMEIRSFDEECLARRIADTHAALRDACEKTGASYTLTENRNSTVTDVPEDRPLVRRVQAAYKSLGIGLAVDSTFGGNDSTWLFHNGIDAVALGTGMAVAHSCEEFITVADLEQTLRVILQLATKA